MFFLVVDSAQRFTVQTSCGGNSGGPLMVKNKVSGDTKVISILSHGVTECDSSKPAVCTLISNTYASN